MEYTIYHLKPEVNQAKYGASPSLLGFNTVCNINLNDFYILEHGNDNGSFTDIGLRYLLSYIFMKAYSKEKDIEYDYYKDISHNKKLNHNCIVKLEDKYYIGVWNWNTWHTDYYDITSEIKSQKELEVNKKQIKKYSLISGLVFSCAMVAFGILYALL